MAGMYGCFKSRNSDSAAMASGPSDVMGNQEPAEAAEECSGKKKSKFQTFKKFFARKKRKEPPAAGADAGLKASQSSDNVSKTSENNTLTRSEKDKGSGSKISLGSKALSHDSVFVSDSSEANEALGASQDSIHGKVKSLQLQLKQAIRLGSPPSLMCVKRIEDAGTMSEDDGLPCSPPEYTTLHTVSQAQRTSSISLEGMDSDDDQLSCAASSRAVSPLVVPGDFSQPASPFGCLDNSAAKHKLGLRYKACNRRKPARRVEMRAEGDSVVEKILNTSITETLEQKEQEETTEAVSFDEVKPKEDRKEGDEEDEEEEEEVQPQHSRRFLLRDEEEREEREVEVEVEADVSHGPDTSSPAELCLSEEDSPDAQPPPSSTHSSRASSLDSSSATPEPPAGPRESLLDAPGITYGAEEDGTESDLGLQEEEDEEVEEKREEEESSFLQEVLSSLKTPLSSHSLDSEAVVLEIREEVKEEEREDVAVEDGGEVKAKESAEDEPVSYQAAPVGSLLTDRTTEEEEEEEQEDEEVPPSSSPCRDVEDTKEEAAVEEEEEELVEQFSHHGNEEEDTEEAEEVKPDEPKETLTVDQAEEEEEGRGQEEESEEEEEQVTELKEEKAEVEEEEPEEREEDSEEVDEGMKTAEDAEEVMEEESDDVEKMTDMLPDAAGEEPETAPYGIDEGGGGIVCSPQHTNDDEIPTDSHGLDFAETLESQAASSESFGEQRAEEDGEAEQISDEEENGPDAAQTEQQVEQDDGEISHPDMKDQTETVPSKPPSLSLPDSRHETPTQDSPISPSKTTTLHINLLSPSKKKASPFFQQSPTAEHPKDNETPSPAPAVADQVTASTEEELSDTVKTEEEETQSPLEEAAPVSQPSPGSDQGKVRFTIAPAWQRSLSAEDAKDSLTPPSSSSSSSSSPVTCTSAPPLSAITGPRDVEAEATTNEDREAEAEPASPAKVELVLSPTRARSAETTPAKPPSSTTSPPPPIKAAAGTQESSVVVEGNPDNPFGVRLRKTSVLHRFSSEEESAESPIEPPAQPSICKVDSPQPISVKPPIIQPISNKPALPKKPDAHGDNAVKSRRISDPAAAHGAPAGSDSPSWISVAKQKQKIYKENSLEEIAVKKEEQERKSSLPMYVSSAVNREHSNKTAESTGKVAPLDINKPSEKETRRALSPPAPVPPQPSKSQSPPCPVPPKPQVLPSIAKHPAQRSLSPPTPVPVAQKPPSCTSPPPLSKPATSAKMPQSTTVTSPPFSSRTAPEKSASPRAPGLTGQTPPSPRGLPPPALAQDEPPWMALAKKKAKAWSEMPQIVQ